MAKFNVTLEARNAGAIGWPSVYRFYVDAADHELAKEAAREQAYREGLEHVHVRSVEVAS
jgi:hypothetical protein